jgi:hypothetical protein
VSVFILSHLSKFHSECRGSKNIIRGAVTTGHDWIFLILKMNANGDGAIYAQSLERIRLMTVVPPGKEELSRIMCNVIAGIIAYWASFINSQCHCPHLPLILVWVHR